MDRSALAVAAVLLCAALGHAQLYEGEACQLNDGSSGVCRTATGCPGEQDHINRGSTPVSCSSTNNVTTVCCRHATTVPKEPTTRRTTPESRVDGKTKAGRKCQEYAQNVYARTTDMTLLLDRREYNVSDCPMVTETLIIGGEDALPKEFPHMAALGYGSDKNTAQWLCGGTLISERFVLTAAHCLSARAIGNVAWVRLGDLNLNSTEDNATPVTLAVIERINHEECIPPARYNDIALLKLERDVTFSPFIRPACLYTKPGNPAGSPTITAIGWGKRNHTHEGRSDTLRKVNLQLQDPSRCSSTFRAHIRPNHMLHMGIRSESMICAGEPNGGKDTCAGDSGGPLQIRLASPDPYCMYSVIGLTSFGAVACGLGDQPAVYTRVSHYIPWIERHVWP